MTRSLFFITFSLATAIACTKNEITENPDCPGTTEPEENSITIIPDEVVIDENETFQLKVESSEGSIDVSDLNWTSSDPSIVEVSETGTVTAIAAGKAVVTASSGKLSASCKVTVNGNFYSMLIDPLQKIYSGYEAVSSSRPIEVAKGETAVVQINVGSRTEFLGEVTAEIIQVAREGHQGIEILPTISWLREITASSGWWDASSEPSDAEESDDGKYPDPIVPYSEYKVSLEPGSRAQLWLEFDITKECPAGSYYGKINFTAGNKSIIQDFEIKVYPVALPEDPEMTICQWQHGTLDAMNGGTAVEWGTEQYFALQREVLKVAVEHGQNAFKLSKGLTPYGITCWGEWDDEIGDYVFRFDFSELLDKEMENIISVCPDLKQIHGPAFMAIDNKNGFIPELGRPGIICAYRYFKTDAEGEYVMDPSGKAPVIEWVGASSRLGIDTNPLVKKYFSDYFRDLGKYLKSKKLPDGRTWLDIYVQNLCDEPHSTWSISWNEYAKMLKNGCPEMKCFDPTSVKLDPEVCDFPCPILDKFKSIKAEGNQIQWMYTSILPQKEYANRLIKMPLIKTRLLHWINFKYKAPGYLHWGLCYWIDTENCWGDVGSGDNFVLYPGNGKVYPSIRLAAMRDGIRDYELLRLVREKSESKADEFASEIVIDYDKYNTDIDKFRDVRHEILEYLSEQ